MLERVSHGELPAKHHIALRDSNGRMRYEHCLTRAGFDGPYSILYHVDRPQALVAVAEAGARPPLIAADASAPELRRRHYRSTRIARTAADGRVPLLRNADVTISVVKPVTNA